MASSITALTLAITVGLVRLCDLVECTYCMFVCVSNGYSGIRSSLINRTLIDTLKGLGFCLELFKMTLLLKVLNENERRSHDKNTIAFYFVVVIGYLFRHLSRRVTKTNKHRQYFIINFNIKSIDSLNSKLWTLHDESEKSTIHKHIISNLGLSSISYKENLLSERINNKNLTDFYKVQSFYNYKANHLLNTHY